MQQHLKINSEEVFVTATVRKPIADGGGGNIAKIINLKLNLKLFETILILYFHPIVIIFGIY